MRLFRFGSLHNEKPGVIAENGTMFDVSAFGEDYDENFFGTNGLSRLSTWLSVNYSQCPLVKPSERIACCISRPSKVICVGLNYAKHAHETQSPVPSEPIIFFKSTTALCGSHDNVVIPRNSTKTDWEVELAVVIGTKASYVAESEAMNYIAGYAVHNDYSERHFQLERNGQWVKGKSCDTFGPLGPHLVTSEEIADPANLDLWLSLNGEILQRSNTSDMIFGIPFLISYISQFMTLLPGDVISTGTPSGVGLGLNRFLKVGDVVELGIERLGSQRQEAIAFSTSLNR